MHEGDEKLVSKAIRTANKHVQAHTPRLRCSLHVSWPLLVLLVTSRPACGLNTHISCTGTRCVHKPQTTNLFACPATDDCPVLHPLPQLVTESKEGGEHSPPLTTECPWEDLVLFLFFVFLHVVSKVPEHAQHQMAHIVTCWTCAACRHGSDDTSAVLGLHAVASQAYVYTL